MPPAPMYQRPGHYTTQTPQPPRHDAIFSGVESVGNLVQVNQPNDSHCHDRESYAFVKMPPGDFEAVRFAFEDGFHFKKGWMVSGYGFLVRG